MSKCPTCGREQKRSLNQNDIGHVWYKQIADELKENTPLEVRCFCKLSYGVPILETENEVFRDAYQQTFAVLNYEKRLEAMKLLPVTRLMTVSQKSQYLQAIQNAYFGRVRLEFPNE